MDNRQWIRKSRRNFTGWIILTRVLLWTVNQASSENFHRVDNTDSASLTCHRELLTTWTDGREWTTNIQTVNQTKLGGSSHRDTEDSPCRLRNTEALSRRTSDRFLWKVSRTFRAGRDTRALLAPLPSHRQKTRLLQAWCRFLCPTRLWTLRIHTIRTVWLQEPVFWVPRHCWLWEYHIIRTVWLQ